MPLFPWASEKSFFHFSVLTGCIASRYGMAAAPQRKGKPKKGC